MSKKTPLLILLLICLPLLSFAQDKPALSLEVIDPFIEVRTGPGRGYPIFYVMEQGENIEVLVRRDGWYEVRAENGRVGWVSPSQLSRTLQATGEPADLPSVSFGNYLTNKWRIGFSTGQVVTGDTADLFSVAASYRFNSWFALEGEYGRFFDSSDRGNFYGANLLFEPFSHWRLSPELILGSGKRSSSTQPELPQEEDKNFSFINYGLGFNYYLGRNFVVRSDYRWTAVSEDNDTVTLQSWKLGFNTFF